MVKKILTHPITNPIYIGKLVFPKYWVFGQNPLSLASTPEHIHPFLNEIEVIAKDFVVGDDWLIRFHHRKCLTWEVYIFSNYMGLHEYLQYSLIQAKKQNP